MDYDSLLELAKTRRSVRKIKPDLVPDEYVEKIIEVARWAPSGGNSQPWQFIVVRKDELRKRIFEIIVENQDTMMKIELTRDEDIRFNFRPLGFVNAPVFIIQLGDHRLKDCYPLSVRLTHGDKTFDSSQASAFLYMMLAAKSLGLAAQWVSASSDAYPQALIKKLLGVPSELEIYDMMVLGYPDMTPPPRLVRSKQDIVHYDGYDRSKYSTDQQTRGYIIKIRQGVPI
jgi:nitroreductase